MRKKTINKSEHTINELKLTVMLTAAYPIIPKILKTNISVIITIKYCLLGTLKSYFKCESNQ